jgi:hypothetical protein
MKKIKSLEWDSNPLNGIPEFHKWDYLVNERKLMKEK